MSGGFFRGTSADQDTRFSNKQAKLLKSQKFAPELDHLVDMTKVKMDVIRPWIATRATELLGFEDEVLINFVYGLLDGKEVDGKQIQIQLTGFMEKNTGKFMKELWGLLLSAQNNVSGVPQQFLDAKEEETRKKKAETDRIAQEIQKRRDMDGREPERERKSRFDGEGGSSKFTKDASDSVSKFSKPRASSDQPEEDGEAHEMHGSAAKNGRSRSPHTNDRSPSPARVSSPTRSNNKSVLRSRSNSEERHKSRSLSVPPQSPRRSVSPGRRYQSPERRYRSPKRHYRSPPRRSISPRRRHSTRVTRSPLRRRSPHPRRRSRSRQRSPSPSRYRSPLARRRSPRRRSPSPYRRRSPPRRRSPSPYRRRSPSPPHRRSPSPLRRRSPVKARRRSPSPVRRRSPIRQRSVSPSRGRSTSPLRRRSPPARSPNRRRSPLPPLRSPKKRTAESPISPPPRKRSPSPYSSQSPSPQTCRSLSREHDRRTNGNDSRRYRNEQTSRRDELTSRRVDARKSPANHILERELSERSKQKVSGSVSGKVPISIRSPQRDTKNQSGERRKMPFVSPENSLSNSVSPTDLQKVNPGSVSRKVPISLRSPQRDMENRSGDSRKMPVVSPENSVSNSESPTAKQKVDPRTTRRSRSLSKSPIKQTGSRMPRHDISGTSEEEEHMTRARNDSSHKRSRALHRDVSPESPDRREFRQSPGASARPPHSELKKKDRRHESDVSLHERHAPQLPKLSEEIEFLSERVREERGTLSQHDRERSAKLLKRDVSLERMEHHEQVGNDGSRHRQSGDEFTELHRGTESIPRFKKKIDKKTRLDTRNSDSEETGSYRNENMEKRRHKKSDKRKRDYDETSESDSQIEDKKEAKRRRKDEKKQRKEEKRRKREERHRRKLERRAGKMKMKSIDTVSPPSDFVMYQGGSGDSDGVTGTRKGSHRSKADEAESEQKKLEIELREKALESLRAKKAISH